MDEIFLVNSASFQDFEVSASLRAGPGVIVDFTAASEVTGTFVGDGRLLFGTSASYIEPGFNTSASYATSASTIIPGSSFFIVSGSDGIPPSFVDVYDVPATSYIPPFREGRMWYDGQYHNMDYYTDDPGFRAQICKELIIRVHNPFGSLLPRLTVVYVSGSSGESPDVYPAVADGTGAKSKIIGVIRSDISSGSSGYMLTRGVMHRSDMSAYDVGTALWLSPTIPGGLTSTKPGQPSETVLVGYCSEAGTNGSFVCAIQDYPAPANAYAGMTSTPTFVDNTASFELYVGSATVNLYGNPQGYGAVTGYPVAAMTFSVPTSTTASYIYATLNGTTASYGITDNMSLINNISIVPVVTVYRADQDIHWLASEYEGLALANRLDLRLASTERFAWQSGFTLVDTGSNDYFISAGQVWYGATPLSASDFDSRLTESIEIPVLYNETHWVYHVAGQWTIPTGSAIQTQGKYNNYYYDNGTNLQPLSNGYYCVNYFFRILGDNAIDHDTFVVLGQAQYTDVASAENDMVPGDIPNVLSDVGILVGRMIIQSGSLTAAKVESAFTTNFGSSGVTTLQHNNLIGIQGGSGGQYYHLNLSEYTGTGTGVLVRQTGASITGSITFAESSSHANNSNNALVSATASFVSLAQSASFITASNVRGVVTSASYSENASYAISASHANLADSASFYPSFPTAVPSASWVSASAKITTSDTASYVTASNIVGVVSSASFATSASWAPEPSIPTAVPSASWVSASAKITTADTASFVTASNVVGAVTTAQTAYVANAINFVPVAASSASWVSASAFITTAQTASFVTASNVVGVVSSASFATSASWAPQPSIPTAVLSASWVSASAKITTADTASFVTASNLFGAVTTAVTAYTANAINFIPAVAVSASWVSASNLINSASYAATASVALNASTPYAVENATQSLFATQSLNATASISSSYAATASVALNASVPTSVPSASWVSASAFITTAQTASYVTASNISGVVTSASFATSASWAPGGQAAASVSASWASSSLSCSISASAANVDYSLVLTTTTSASLGFGIFLVDGSDALTYNPSTETIKGANLSGTASWASSASFITASLVQGAIATAQTAYVSNTASYVTASNVNGAVATAAVAYNANTASYALTTPSSIFSRGGTLYNGSYIPNTLTWITVWRAPFNCTASAFNANASTNAGFVASASVNARKNGASNLLTASGYPITASSTYVSLGPTFFTNQNFATGDELDIGFIGTTGSVQQINIQIDFTK